MRFGGDPGPATPQLACQQPPVSLEHIDVIIRYRPHSRNIL